MAVLAASKTVRLFLPLALYVKGKTGSVSKATTSPAAQLHWGTRSTGALLIC